MADKGKAISIASILASFSSSVNIDSIESTDLSQPLWRRVKRSKIDTEKKLPMVEATYNSNVISALDDSLVSVLEFSRDRKMMSVLCTRKQQEVMFSKGAPESIIARCTNILCNSDGSSVPLTADIRAELEARFQRVRNPKLRLKRKPCFLYCLNPFPSSCTQQYWKMNT
ncbi:Calcium-transporting ATPase 3 endoplasmic reticulum-type [Nymphaea thermarum]|nr:Calcium-transporting ATPase 3 endoplasmic reticulum-type [Nymphaea thermarum]